MKKQEIKYYQIIWKELGLDYFEGTEKELKKYIRVMKIILIDPRHTILELTKEEYIIEEEEFEPERYLRMVMSRED